MIKYILISLFAVMTLTSCAEMQTKRHASINTSKSPSTLRTIIIDGEAYTESSRGEFQSFRCTDYRREGNKIISVGKTLIEVGQFSDLLDTEVGYILFDGTNKGTAAYYERLGLSRVWSWGAKLKFQFHLEPDEIGRYYDFRGTPAGEKITSLNAYKCYKY
jgi:hypothetical protein